MTDEPSENGDGTDDRWGDSSPAEPPSGAASDSHGTDSGADEVDTSTDEWGASDRTERSSADDPSARDERDGGWDRIPIDLSGSSDDGADADALEDDEYAPEANSAPVEPGDPDLENALFVLLGALAMVLVIARIVMIPMG